MKKIISEENLSPIKIWASDLEDNAEVQIRNTASLPFIFKHIAVMPDAHAGRGSTIGTVIATKGAIIPSAIGVDIGCGMCAIKLPFAVNMLGSLRELRISIERSIPTGRDGNRDVSDRVGLSFSELGFPPSVAQMNKKLKKAALQLGSLGGGNHFIEVCTDTDDGVWIMLHSGSRNIGKELAETHIDKAKGLMRERLEQLPDPDLAFFTEEMPEFKAYIGDLLWAQQYARFNRNEMVLRIVKDLSYHVYKDARLLTEIDSLFRVDCHHNFCQIENHFDENIWVTRKGAVSAKLGEYGIIPGSMGAKSYIVKGRGNPESFHSCSHGAGRKMSRTQARNTFTETDLQAQTNGVECRKDRAVLDEIPSAYKDIDQVMSDQTDLVEVVCQLKQLICIKGG
jgi:tRNA-splicing ligase RtcB